MLYFILPVDRIIRKRKTDHKKREAKCFPFVFSRAEFIPLLIFQQQELAPEPVLPQGPV